MENIKKILVIKAGALGDLVRTFPTLVYLRERFPDAHITLMTGEEYVEAVAPCPHIDEIIPYKRRKNTEDIGGFIKFALDLRRRGFDLALNLQNTKRFDFLAKISGAKHRSPIIELDRPLDGVQGVFEILRAAGLEPGEPKYEFWLTDEDRAFAKNFLKENGLESVRILGINPGGAWPTKQWPLKHFAALADRAKAELGLETLIFGGPGEENRAEEIANLMRAGKPVSAAGKTSIRRAAALMSACSAVVSNDSGLMHISAMCRVPTIGLFGPTSPELCGPAGPGNAAISQNLPCAPCYKRDCQYDSIECMTRIISTQVFNTLIKIV